MSEPLSKQELSAELIGYQLGLCDEGDRRRVEATLRDRRALASACARVERLLTPLEGDESPAPPADLVASILDRVQESRNTLPFTQRAAALLPTPVESGGRGPMFNLRELVGLAAAIALFLGILVPGYRTARQSAQQAMCANNMRLIGEGYASYAATYGNPMPYVRRMRSGDTWLPTGDGTTRFKNSPNAWVLVSTRLVQGKAFNCPERSQDIPLETDPPEGLNDFPDPRNNSMATMAITENWTLRNFDPEMPVAADMNPLIDDAEASTGAGRSSENSRSHGGRGQNVLRGELSVRWARTPRVGVDNDDIYRLIGIQEYTGQEWPRLRSDAFLIP
ncbi:MAG TPA: hypothetical protein VJZ71_15170 [Phycisphaerae bacterium]|nr:hypothetical protein [Phycisphaerae bacterium]